MTEHSNADGRPKRAANNRSASEEAAVSGETPLDFLLRGMRDPSIDHRVRVNMAKVAARYVHRKVPNTVSADTETAEPAKFDPHDQRQRLELARNIIFMVAIAKHEGKPVPDLIVKLLGPDMVAKMMKDGPTIR